MAIQTLPPPARERQGTTKAARAYELDWLRVLSVLLLIYFHTARAFNYEPWHIRNDVLSRPLDEFVRFLSLWQMPLMFLLAGAATFFALGVRSGRTYAGERFRRLLVPLLFGMFVLIPPQIYVERISGWVTERQSPIDFHGSFLEFWPRVLNGTPYPEGDTSWHHLWFLGYLFLYSVIALPLLLWLRGPAGRRMIGRTAAWLSRGRTILLLAAPLAVVELALRASFPSTHDLVTDWANHAHFLLVLLYGYLLLADPRLRLALTRNRRLALALGAATWLVLRTFDLDPVMGRPLRALSEWSWLVALLGYAQVYLNRPSRALTRANELVMPFYMWHQTVIVVVAYFVVQWSAGIAVKFAVISTVALVATLLLCLLVQRFRVTRFLFGLRAKQTH